MSEFDLIAKINAQTAALTLARADVVLGIGDDCALLAPPAGMHLALSTDTLVSGVHFFPDANPIDLGHKALAVNLSDLAAMGAKPLWASLNLTLPQADPEFVEQFISGFSALAHQHGIALIGGDTTRGPLNIAVTVIGSVAPGTALRRDGARVGELIFVSGALGGAACAVQRRLAGMPEIAAISARLDRPQPRTALGLALVGKSRCAIDISDGLLAELGHICRASHVGVRIDSTQIPIHRALEGLPEALSLALSGGDDYELCFTAPAQQQAEILALSASLGVDLRVIGEVITGSEVQLLGRSGEQLRVSQTGYQHFADERKT